MRKIVAILFSVAALAMAQGPRRAPGFACTAALILAIGIGGTTAIFSALNPILFEPLPYPHAARILTVWDTYKSQRFETTFGTYREIAARSSSFETLSTFEPWQPVIPQNFENGVNSFTQIRQGDLLVHHPYESFNASVERFVTAAALRPSRRTIPG